MILLLFDQLSNVLEVGHLSSGSDECVWSNLFDSLSVHVACERAEGHCSKYAISTSYRLLDD